MGFPRIDRLSWKLGLATAAIVVFCQLTGFFFVQRYYADQLIRNIREHTVLETMLISQALEYQMLEKDDRLIRRMTESFAREHSFQRVLILNRKGEVKFSSDPEIRSAHFGEDSPTCQECHKKAPAERARSVLLSTEGGNMLRCVLPIVNRPACHDCHPPEHKINGMVVVDAPLSKALREIERTTGFLAIGTILIGLMLLAGNGYIVRRLILKRLFRFEAATRALAEGDLESRVPVEGNDSLTRVEEQFNKMADSLGSALVQLQQQRASLNRVINSVDDGMVVLDPDRKIVAANDAFLRRFNLDREGLVSRICGSDGRGRGCSGFDECEECPTLQCFEAGTAQVAVRTRTLVDGSTRQEEVLASPVMSKDGSVSHVVEVWRDITERRSAEARMAEYQRLVSLGMLASGFSHEVNTPLASIGTCLDGIRRLTRGSPSPSGRDLSSMAELAHIAATQVQRCGSITQQFLQLARGRSLSGEVVDLKSNADMAARLCKHKAKEAGVEVEVCGEPEARSAMANGSAVQQVLLNLVINAIEASEAGQKVRISFRHTSGQEILVQDDGCGISREDVRTVFEPFFTRKEKGIGLGLFVSLNLARSWGGDITVESRPGHGTTFSVLFPGNSDREATTDDASQDPDSR